MYNVIQSYNFFVNLSDLSESVSEDFKVVAFHLYSGKYYLLNFTTQFLGQYETVTQLNKPINSGESEIYVNDVTLLSVEDFITLELEMFKIVGIDNVNQTARRNRPVKEVHIYGVDVLRIMYPALHNSVIVSAVLNDEPKGLYRVYAVNNSKIFLESDVDNV